MGELLTAEQMRAIEKVAIASGGVSGLELMERAGRSVIESIMEWRAELALSVYRAVVFCGPGNNGGDGFVVARLLKERGWEVEVVLFGDGAKLPPDAMENAQRWSQLGAIESWEGYSFDCDQPPHVAVDALFGIGLSRPIEDARLREGFCSEKFWSSEDSPCGLEIGEAGRGVKGSPPLTVAVDLPSGLCADSGRFLSGISKRDPQSELQVPQGESPSADRILTVTFHKPKRGHFLTDGPALCGRLVVKPLGLDALNTVPRSALRDVCFSSEHVSLIDGPTVALGKRACGNKFDHGHALVLSGGPGAGGAARLAARGALRIGAGLVTVGSPPSALAENAARLDAIMLRPLEDCEELAGLLSDERINALCLGPGYGVGEETRAAAAVVLRTERAAVLDADALTSFAEDPAALFSLLHGKCVLTPHEGEFGRLFPDLRARLMEPAVRGPVWSKVDAALAAAERAGCVVLFKGADTVIAAPDGRSAIVSARYGHTAPWLATAGSGDVLAGFIAGLLARGHPPLVAAGTAAWLHVECARKFGPGLIAEDLPEQLPAVLRSFGSAL